MRQIPRIRTGPLRSRGFSLIELMVALSLAAVILGAAAAYSVPTLARERMRSATYDAKLLMQLARLEAVGRKRDCRFVLDAAARRFEVWDSRGTATYVDDLLIRERPLAASVALRRPDVGPSVTLDRIGSSDSFQVVFDRKGVAVDGVGSIYLAGAQRFVSLQVFAAGGTAISQWNGGEWERL